MLKKVIVILILATLVLTGCEEIYTPTPLTEAPVQVASPTEPVELVSPTAVIPPRSPQLPPPTITPTPIVYVVVRGDTLAGIAAMYGVSVEALQAANGIQNPLLLQIGQELVIPVGDQGGAVEGRTILPTPTPLPFYVRGVSFYETQTGSLDCLGEVVNTTAFVATNVQVRVTLFDATGAVVIEGDAFVAADLLPPDARAPFRILFIAPPENFVSHRADIVRGSAAGELADEYLYLTVEGVTGVPSGPQFAISGVVRNDDPQRTAATVIVVATTYDAEGRVNGFRQQRIDGGEPLAPGASRPFQLLFSTYGGMPADYAVIAFGRRE